MTTVVIELQVEINVDNNDDKYPLCAQALGNEAAEACGRCAYCAQTKLEGCKQKLADYLAGKAHDYITNKRLLHHTFSVTCVTDA